MAENPNIHFDDFIANVQPDPAKPEATIMLSGYIGHGADGEVRVYPDPTLATWYDIPAADIVHSVPAPDAKLGGSYVWVRASAQIKPGSIDAATAPAPDAAAPDAAAPDAAAAAAAPAAQQAAPNFTIGAGCTFICAQQGGGVHPTPTAQPTPATHCFICPPRTIVTETCTPAVGCTFNVHCVHPTTTVLTTPATLCSPAFICNQPTPPVICNIVASPNCPGPGPGTPVQTPQIQPQQQFAAAAIQPTPTAQTHCFVCPPLTQPPACPVHTVPPACPVLSAPQHCPTVPPICPVQTLATVCTQPPACIHRTFVDCTIVGCTHIGCPTAATVCTQPPACPHLSFAPPCPSAGIACTFVNCPTQPNVCLHTQANFCVQLTQPQICNIVASPNCPGPGPGTPVQIPQVGPQQQFAAAAIQPTPTAQTHCFVCPPLTQPPACPAHTVPPACPLLSAPPHCPTVAPICPHPTPGTFCTETCNTLLPGCGQHPTAATICSETCNTLLVGCGQHPTAATICSETCNTMLVGCLPTLPANCFPVTLPQVCNIAVSPNCPGPGPGTPVQIPQGGPQQQFAAAAVQPTPTAQSHCIVCPPVTQPPACQLPTLPTPCPICPTQLQCTLQPPCQVHTPPAPCPPPPTLPTVCTQWPQCPNPITHVDCTLLPLCQSPPAVCTHVLGCQIHTVQPGCPHPTLAPPCPSVGIACTVVNCPTQPNVCQHTAPIVCLHTQPNICNIVASPNCPGPGPGTPVQIPQVGPQQQFAAAAVQPTPSAVHQCGGNTAPPACHPSVNVICPTPSAVHQCGGNTAAPGCQPSVNVICPTPSAVHQCGTLANVPPSGTMHQCCGAQAGGGFPTLQACFPPTANCMTIPARCGVFTPFGTQ
jgi:hypothetical protein